MKKLSLSSPVELITPMSVRAWRAMYEANIATIDDLVEAINSKALLKLPNCGQKTVRELTTILKKHKLYQESETMTVSNMRAKIRELEARLDAFNSSNDSAFARRVREVCCLLIAKDRELL
jgi:DNA-directed RNA polymerase alpha subunit